eukprot:13036548-Alexandrium_andersonii.AAC.1
MPMLSGLLVREDGLGRDVGRKNHGFGRAPNICYAGLLLAAMVVALPHCCHTSATPSAAHLQH